MLGTTWLSTLPALGSSSDSLVFPGKEHGVKEMIIFDNGIIIFSEAGHTYKAMLFDNF